MVAGVIERLDEAIDAVADIDPDTLGDTELGELIIGLQRARHRLAGATARSFTGRLRRTIEVRDRHCQHPSGCDVPATNCDVDHIVPAHTGGPTTQFNGRLQCRPHNRDTTIHDHNATQMPERPVTVLDEIRARLRWRYHHEDDQPAA